MKLAYPLALAATFVACTGRMHDDDSNLLGNDISSLRAETTRRHAAVFAAPNLDDMMDDTGRHDDEVDELMNRMSLHMGGMSSCSGNGMSMMHGKMSEMSTEMADHGSAMGAATDIESARGACTQHDAAMNDMLDGMGKALNSMGCM